MLHQKQVKSVLNKHKKRDSWFLDDYSVNPYEGCSCNCLYCYIRGSKYGENMEEGLASKTNALEVFEKQLATKGKKKSIWYCSCRFRHRCLYTSGRKIPDYTEGILELLLKYRFPVFISTKCTLIKRDIELLKEIDKTAILPDDLKDNFEKRCYSFSFRFHIG